MTQATRSHGSLGSLARSRLRELAQNLKAIVDLPVDNEDSKTIEDSLSSNIASGVAGINRFSANLQSPIDRFHFQRRVPAICSSPHQGS
jgi:hypothetical protein